MWLFGPVRLYNIVLRSRMPTLFSPVLFSPICTRQNVTRILWILFSLVILHFFPKWHGIKRQQIEPLPGKLSIQTTFTSVQLTNYAVVETSLGGGKVRTVQSPAPSILLFCFFAIKISIPYAFALLLVCFVGFTCCVDLSKSLPVVRTFFSFVQKTKVYTKIVPISIWLWGVSVWPVYMDILNLVIKGDSVRILSRNLHAFILLQRTTQWAV